MTKEQFLKDFNAINLVYNNSMMRESLERHIDELLEDEHKRIADLVSEYCEEHGIYDWGIIDLIREGGNNG